MTYEAPRSLSLVGFSARRDNSLIYRLNRIYNASNVSNIDLDHVAQGVSLNYKLATGVRTNDGYTWFSCLQFWADKGTVRVLFPWAQDFENQDSKLDRSIEVFTTEGVSRNALEGLMESLGYQITLGKMDKKDAPFDKRAWCA